MHLDGAEVLTPPIHDLIDPDIFHQLAKVMENRHGDPLAAVRGSDPIAILPLILFELHRIQGDEQIRMIDLCRAVGASGYFSGPGGEQYLDTTRFESSGLRLEIQQFQHPLYRQVYEPFMPAMSAIDLLFCCGPDALTRLRGARAGQNVVTAGQPALFTRVLDETAETPSETGARSREGGRHT